MTQTMSHPTYQMPRKVAELSNHLYCVLEYTPEQRKSIAMRHYLSQQVPPQYSPATPVPGNPHAMTVFVGMGITADGQEIPEFATVHVPGVLVENEEFVTGYHYGMQAAYEESEYGEQAVSEQEVIKTFLESAADEVMFSEEGESHAFSAGFLFGYAYGCSLVGTETFQQWANGGTLPRPLAS